MRGQTKQIKTLSLSGKIYIQCYNDSLNPDDGDILLAPHIENRNNYMLSSDLYFYLGNKGFFRLHVYIKKEWGNLVPGEFLSTKENHFSKTELAITTANLCTELLANFAGTKIYQTYRNHYTIYKYNPGQFKGKKGHRF